ncbi:aldehyde dehydrogenase [Paraburkholderia sp. LEh10]|uniref:aldehyde dehydrogenase n=1 Tax=Paraburkholderia sp. LEh10 TaxID=2821353 RepID=UPI001AE7F936|nr:aldehyde dehydrogenase [Paraburkholderia sp. LEh10]MBP0590422.1 aldehyde dehydrogenase [Paraburkholderia sp. LEh10]
MNADLIIDNVPVKSSDGGTFERRNPFGDKVVTTAAAGTVADATHAADSAARAFEGWSQTGPSERRRILLAVADRLEAKIEPITAAMAAEIGGSAMWAGLNVNLAASLLREAAGLTTQMSGETIPTDRAGALSMTVRQPVGVVLSMAPWNGPVLLGARSIAYPIACGNTVVFRGSEISPKTHALLVEAFHEGGLPPGVLNFVLNAPAAGPDIVDALINHPAVRRINFTGSTRVGRIIAEKAGHALKRCLLELGGKAPFVVLDDADLDAAVNAATFGSFMYQGQICMTTERVVVDESIADAFVERFAKRAKALAIGDPTRDPSIVIGPVIDTRSGDRLNHLIRDALDKGAVLAAGGLAEGAMMRPTILDRCTPEMTVYDEETFGPVTIVVRVSGIEEAVRVANDTQYGLAASVFGRDAYRALQVARRIDAGAVHVNGATVQNEPQAPYGGMKASGYGRFDGRAVIDEFTELKWLTIEHANQPYPI